MRVVLAVIAGYAAMFIGVFSMLTLAYALLKADGAFKAGSFEVSTAWLMISFVVGFVAAVVGGLVAGRIAPVKAPKILAGVVLVLGLVMGMVTINSDQWKAPPVPRIGEVSNADAMNNAKQPALTLFLNPILGAVGVMVGASLAGSRRA